MSLLIIDSFDHYATADVTAERKWYTYDQEDSSGGTQAIDPSGGRRSGGALKMSTDDGIFNVISPICRRFGFAGDDTITSACIVGFAFKGSGAGAFVTDFQGTFYPTFYPWAGVKSPFAGPQIANNWLLNIRTQDDTGSLYGMVIFTLESNGQIFAYLGEDPTSSPEAGLQFIGRTDRALHPEQWYFLEFKTLIDNSSGTIEIRVNGETWLSLSGIKTYILSDSAGDPFPGIPQVGWCEVCIGHLSSGTQGVADHGPNAGDHIWHIDDVYVASGGVTDTNDVADFWGDHAIEVKQVTGTGALTQLTPGGADPNWQQVNDDTPDGDVSYNSADNSGDADVYVVEDATSGATVDAIQVLACVRSVLAVAVAQAALRSTGVNYAGPSTLVQTEYIYVHNVWTKDPADDGVISDTDWNAMQVGVRRG
jgi:hypothetical protein